jgi:biopolymer transport protein ExbB
MQKKLEGFMMKWQKLTGALAGALLMTMVLGAVKAEAWWDTKWTARRKVAFDLSDKGAGIKENLTEVPVLVRLHSGNFSFAGAKKDGSDLRFMSSDDKSPLKFHLEKYDPKQEIALVWVKVPQLAGGGSADSVWLYYGNDAAPAAAEPGGTYDTAQVLVYHLNETEGGPKDATSYANHAAAFSGSHATPSVIGDGYSFKGNGEKLVVQRSASLNFAKGLTFSCWVRINGPQQDAHLFSWVDAGQQIVVGIDGDKPYFRVGAGGKAPVTSEKKGALTLKAWHLVAVTADNEKQMGALYLDGKQVAAANLLAPLPSPAGELAFGGSMAGGNAFAGDLDEIELASVARPAPFLSAAYAGQGQDGKLTSCQQEEGSKGGEGNMTIRLIKTTAKSISLDGWLIIGLCTFMLAMASIVFVLKYSYLLKNRKNNQEFLERFNDLHDPLELDPDSGEYENSSLFRIYQAGSAQIHNWAEKHARGDEDVVLNRSGLNIFRASLDRASSEETAKVNAGLIVLTLGISGGPFWGLLGTVWGVMNTFASLAEAGEANLAAIAPGVASALACTLFGLLVAIPALFAYTFLGVQIKHLNNETHHFIEEYTLKVEGFHGEEA